MWAWIRRLVLALHDRHLVLLELAERQDLLNRPWEAEFVHWCNRDGHWELHGHLPAPDDGRRRGVTGGGWCACAWADASKPWPKRERWTTPGHRERHAHRCGGSTRGGSG